MRWWRRLRATSSRHARWLRCRALGEQKPRLIELADIPPLVEVAQRIVITTHARADGDAIGSVAGLQRVLRGMGKEVAGYLHEVPSPKYAFLTEIEPLVLWGDVLPADVLGRADLIVIVDTCSRSQLADIAEAVASVGPIRLAIDHHATRDAIVDHLVSDVAAAATAGMIADLCDAAGWRIDAQTALLLYTGLATDTGWFRFSNANAAAYRIAARLVDAGARPNELYERLYLSDPAARARLVGTVLSSFELRAEGRLAVIRLTREMMRRCGATHDMSEDLINEPQRVGSVVACVLLAEPAGEGPIRVSFRSKRAIDVAEIAARFGGGGHARAAGARIEGTLNDVADAVVPIMEAAVRRGEQGA